MANKTYKHIATDWELWQERIDPQATMTREQFDAMSVTDRIDLIVETCGPEENDTLYCKINNVRTEAPSGAVAYKYADPTEDAKWLYSDADAREIASEDPSLVEWVYTEAQAQAAAALGSIRTPRKAASSAANGRKGGRPATLTIVRSDQGDGGWSLHPAGSSDGDIADGKAPILASGDATFVDGGWDRPNAADVRAARAALKKIK